MADITYRVEGDYLIPNIILDDEADDSSEEMIGRYGMMREYSCAMKSHFRKSGNQMSGKWKSSYASLLA